MLNFAIIGFGYIGQIHYACIKTLGFNIEAILDTKNIENILDTKTYTNFSTLINNHKINACIIACPSNMHTHYAKLCEKYNIPALIEKPFGQKYIESKNILNCKNKMAVGYQEHFNPVIKYIKQYINLNSIQMIEIKRQNQKPIQNKNILLELTSHDIDIVLFLANYNVNPNSIHILKKENYALISMKLKNIFINIISNANTQVQNREINIYTKTALYKGNLITQSLRKITKSKIITIPLIKTNPIVEQLKAFSSWTANEYSNTYLSSLKNAIKTLEIIDHS